MRRMKLVGLAAALAAVASLTLLASPAVPHAAALRCVDCGDDGGDDGGGGGDTPTTPPPTTTPPARVPDKGPLPENADNGGFTPYTAKGSTYYYAGAYQFGQSDGAYGYFTVPQPTPTLEPSDSHTLAEMAVVLDPHGQNYLEIGWNVDKDLYGDLLPHLFIFHWVDGVPTCYNGCGFVSTSFATVPGMALDAGSIHQFQIQHYMGNWWFGDWTGGYTNWFGYMPDSIWSDRFTSTAYVDWFGEVSVSTDAPCTDMGNGQYASSDYSAAITGIGYFNGPSVVLTERQEHPELYTVRVYSQNNMRFGGPGSNPNPIGVCPSTPMPNYPF